ncbi:hypothetical protein Q6350_03500 [Isoptericola sp. b515]|uniref:hypothetical protein n=1 Tax=Isoptericola sp. b515 TaxID=3064652 RepID=UPI00271377EC|nr:hypothetical protein [Isoptericola sp. b515]MDO8147488.1 hypothetical protein [Isoptericola sp. b515]
MGSVYVDQIAPDGSLLKERDPRLSEAAKVELLLGALPGATRDTYHGERVIRFKDQIILKKQVTHLGKPWPEFKKRIQIPHRWLDVARHASHDSLRTRFVGIYHFGDVTIFVDFDPTGYLGRKANNSAAHVCTNDLHQAQTLGTFSRVDRNGNRLTSVRYDQFAQHLQGSGTEVPRLEAFRRFNDEFLLGQQIESLDAVKEMHAANWPDAFQSEWPGFYLEQQFDRFIRVNGLSDLVRYQKAKRSTQLDYDLVFPTRDVADYYGDLKASNLAAKESPGNDLEDLRRCIETFGRFWYVVYEHETKHARHNDNSATIAWNEWRRSVGYHASSRKAYDELSYAKRFKESVRFVKMLILEVNAANFDVVLRTFAQGKQPDGSARALKVMINKKVIDNFLIFWATAPGYSDNGALGDVEELIEP